MASLSLLLLATALIYATQAVLAARGGARGLDESVGGVRRQRRDLHKMLPYEDSIMTYLDSHRSGGVNDWRGSGLDQALQRLMERDQRQELQEEQRAAYMAALLRLLSEAESAGFVRPGVVEIMEDQEEEEDNQGPPEDFQGPPPPDYDETGRGISMGRPPAAWWGLLEPQLGQALWDRMEPQLSHRLLDRNRSGRVQPTGQAATRQREDALRRLVARILSSISPNNAPVMSSGRRARRDLSDTAAQAISSTPKRTRRSLGDVTLPSPSNEPPLLRVKRLDDKENEKVRAPSTALQRMKRIDTMEEMNHGSRRRQRRALNYNPQILIDQILEYMKD